MILMSLKNRIWINDFDSLVKKTLLTKTVFSIMKNIDFEIKKIFDDWVETDIGKERIEAFESILHKNKEN